MLVHEVMSTSFVTVTKTETVQSALVKIQRKHHYSIPVVEGEARLIGMLTLRDVLLPLYPNRGVYVHDHVDRRHFIEMEKGYSEILGATVEEIMSWNPLTVGPFDSILEAASYMGFNNFRHIPVVDAVGWSGCSVSAISIAGCSRRLLCEHGIQDSVQPSAEVLLVTHQERLAASRTDGTPFKTLGCASGAD